MGDDKDNTLLTSPPGRSLQPENHTLAWAWTWIHRAFIYFDPSCNLYDWWQRAWCIRRLISLLQYCLISIIHTRCFSYDVQFSFGFCFPDIFSHFGTCPANTGRVIGNELMYLWYLSGKVLVSGCVACCQLIACARIACGVRLWTDIKTVPVFSGQNERGYPCWTLLSKLVPRSLIYLIYVSIGNRE